MTRRPYAVQIAGLRLLRFRRDHGVASSDLLERHVTGYQTLDEMLAPDVPCSSRITPRGSGGMNSRAVFATTVGAATGFDRGVPFLVVGGDAPYAISSFHKARRNCMTGRISMPSCVTRRLGSSDTSSRRPTFG